jgi:hypothetical protein
MDPSNRPVNYELPPAALPTSTLAIVSLVAGVLGFGVVPLIGTIVAIITGYMARKETRAVPPTHSGDGMATAGIIMGWVQVGLTVIGICCFVGWFVFVVGLGVSGANQ